jgi:hypothetical protein
MNATRRNRSALSWLSTLVLLLAIGSPAAARQHKASKATSSCDHPCAHVQDCPKVTCECADAAGSGVAACDTEKTHCCAGARTACKRFCEVNHQKWTGRFTPEDATAPQDSDGGAKDASSSASSAACDEPCQKAEDCRTMTCQCAHATAPDVAACDAKTHCCGSTRIVCEHFCRAKKDKWTGKVVDAIPPSDAGSLVDQPSDDETDDYNKGNLRP